MAAGNGRLQSTRELVAARVDGGYLLSTPPFDKSVAEPLPYVPLEDDTLRKPAYTGERGVGFPGYLHFRGLITEDYLAQWNLLQKVETVNRMRSDGLIQGLLLAMTLPLAGATYTVEAAGDSPQAKRAKDLVEDQLFNHLGAAWEDEVRNVLSDIFSYGWKLAATEWRSVKGEYRLAELRPLHPKTIVAGGKNWDLDERGDLRGVWQYGTDGYEWRYEYVPADYLFHTTCLQENKNPEGRSLLRGAYKHWWMNENFYTWLAIGNQRGAMGVPWGTYKPDLMDGSPGGISEAHINNLTKFLQNISVTENSYLVVPEGIDIKNYVVEVKTEQILKSIEHNRVCCAQAFLSMFMMLGTGDKGGAYALSADQTDLFMVAMQFFANYICARFNRRIIPRIVEYNLATDQVPHLACTIARSSAAATAAAMQQWGATGFLTPDVALEDWIRELLGAPPRVGPFVPRATPSLPGPASQESQANPEGEQNTTGKPASETPAEKPAAEGEAPAKPGANGKAARDVPGLTILNTPPQWHEPPAYAALGELVSQFHEELNTRNDGLRDRVWRICGLPQLADETTTTAERRFPGGIRKLAVWDGLTPEQTQALDQAIASFIEDLAGDAQDAESFADSDALVQNWSRLAHATGAEQGRRLTGKEQRSLKPGRNSPEVRQLLENAYGRLTSNSASKLFPNLTKIKETLTEAQAVGQSPLATANILNATFEGFKKYEWQRLARTEMGAAANRGTMDEFRAEGVQSYSWQVSDLACEICQAFTDQVYSVDDGPMPPDDSHPNCLCSIIYVDASEGASAT